MLFLAIFNISSSHFFFVTFAPERAEMPFLWVQGRKYNYIQSREVRHNDADSADEYWTLTPIKYIF